MLTGSRSRRAQNERCRRTEAEEHCEAERRFARYETEPPRIGIAPLRGLRARRKRRPRERRGPERRGVVGDAQTGGVG